MIANEEMLTLLIVPDAPERIKWVVSGENAVIISWLPPRRPNGLLTQYTVYIRMLEQGQDKIIKNTLPAQNLHHEVTDLKLHESYEAWVAASTKVGHGSSTPVVKFQPSTTGKPVSKFWIVEKFLCSPFVKLCRASGILFLKPSSLSKLSEKAAWLSSMKCKSNIRAKTTSWPDDSIYYIKENLKLFETEYSPIDNKRGIRDLLIISMRLQKDIIARKWHTNGNS